MLLVAGAVLFGMACTGLVIPEFRANRQFAETPCTIERVAIAETPAGDGVRYRPDITIQYTVSGQDYHTTTFNVQRDSFGTRETAEAKAAPFEVGHEYPCWYDPIDPSRAVLVRGYSFFLYLVLLVPLSFIVTGSGGLIYTITHWGTSAERRAALARQAAGRDLFESNGAAQPKYPAVPGDANLTNSPGTTLTYRLPLAVAQGWALFLAVSACLLWNGLTAIFVVMAIQRHLQGDPEWLLTLFVMPLVLIGLGLVYYSLRQLLVTTGVGATRIEISHHPLRPGERYEILVGQAGRFSINSLEVLLACDETVTYRQGTDTRTERRRVFTNQVFRRDGFEIQPGMPFETRSPLEIPAAAMHSFKTLHNEIRWKLVVRGDVAGWPDFEREFQVVVYPQAAAQPAVRSTV